MSILLTFHIILMSLSFVVTSIMVVLALFGVATPNKAHRANLITTIVGVTIGAVLLAAHPIGSRCLELTSYIVIFYFAYQYVSVRSKNLITSATSNH